MPNLRTQCSALVRNWALHLLMVASTHVLVPETLFSQWHQASTSKLLRHWITQLLKLFRLAKQFAIAQKPVVAGWDGQYA
jgi:hypothetical protein